MDTSQTATTPRAPGGANNRRTISISIKEANGRQVSRKGQSLSKTKKGKQFFLPKKIVLQKMAWGLRKKKSYKCTISISIKEATADRTPEKGNQE